MAFNFLKILNKTEVTYGRTFNDKRQRHIFNVLFVGVKIIIIQKLCLSTQCIRVRNLFVFRFELIRNVAWSS